MESSQVFLSKVMLNIATSKDQGLNLVRGEVLRGIVQEVKADGLVSLLIKGQVIDAVSEVMVQNGQQLQLMVEDFKDGRAYLKVLTPQLMERIENTNLSMNLKDIGVSAKETNIVMAKKLLAHNLPVTTSNLNELSKGMNLLGGANARNMEITAFALQRGIPINQHSLNSLAQFTAPGNALPRLVEDILQSLAQLSRLSASGLTASISSSGGGEAAPAQLAQEPMLTDKNQAQIEIGGKKMAIETNLPTGSKGNQETMTQAKPDNVANKLTAEQAATAKAAGGENTASAGKATSPETGAALPKLAAEALIQQGKELLDAKNVAAAEKTAGEAAKPGANKVSGEPTAPNAAKTGSEQVNQAAGKPAATTIPAGEKSTPTQISTAVDKPTAEQAATAKAAGGENTQATSRGGTETTTQIPKEIPGSRDIAAAEKTAVEAAKPGANKVSGEPAASNAAKQLPGKDAQTPPNVLSDKNPATAGGQANSKLGLESLFPSLSGEEKAAGQSVLNSNKNNPQTPPNFKSGDLIPDKANVLGKAAVPGDTGVLGDKIIKHLDLLKPLLDLLRIDAGEGKAAVGAKLESALFSEKELIKGLMLLQDIIKNDNTAAKNPLVNDLLQKIDGLEKDLSGQRILNFASRSAVDNTLNYFYFSFPVQTGNEYRLGQIRINKEIGRKGLKNQDNIKLIVSLDTRQMGLVLFHLNWQRSKEIELQGVVENQKVCNHLSHNIEPLLQGLNELGYKTKNLGIKVADNREELSKLRMSLEEAPLNIRPLGIDIRV